MMIIGLMMVNMKMEGNEEHIFRTMQECYELRIGRRKDGWSLNLKKQIFLMPKTTMYYCTLIFYVYYHDILKGFKP